MSNWYRLVLAALHLTVLACTLPAQDTETPLYSLGIRGGAAYVFTSGSIPVISGSTDCGAFTKGTAVGYYGGFEFGYQLLPNFLEVIAGVTYSNRPASLQYERVDNFEVLDPRTNEYVALTRNHEFTANLGFVAVEIGCRIQPLSTIPFALRLTADAGNPLVDASYVQTETIVSPSGVLFPSGTQQRVTGSGDFPGLGTSYGASGMLTYTLSLSKHVQLLPEVGYRYGFNSITSQAAWKQSWASAGLHLRYVITEAPPSPIHHEEPPPPPPPPVVSVPPVPPSAPPVSITALTTAPLEIRETVVTQTFPLLPYVFFDSASAAVPTKYVATTPAAEFNEATLPRETLPIYYRMLDIIGKRLRQNPKVRLIVTGTTDGIELGEPSQRKSLATSRAQGVVDFVKNRWNLSDEQFEIRTAERPTHTSNEKYAEGIQENRRAELDATSPMLLAPIVHSRFMEYVPVQPKQEFSTTVLNPESARRWELTVKHGTRTVATRRQEGSPPQHISFDLNQEITNQLGAIVGTADSLGAHLTIASSDSSVHAQTTFPVVKTVSNFEVSRLSLIVFDYDRADISKQNQEMMQRVVQAAVRDGSTATIVGSTDKLGELSHNLELSTARAKAVESTAKSIAPGLTLTKVEGIGPSVLPYNNALPEGRFYCRTVSLTITTPLR